MPPTAGAFARTTQVPFRLVRSVVFFTTQTFLVVVFHFSFAP